MEARRVYRGIFVATLMLLSLCLMGGISRALLVGGSLPPLSRSYMPHIDLQQYTRAAEQLRLAIEIDFQARRAPRALALIALENGDVETELYALRRVRRKSPDDVAVRNAVSEALLKRGDVGPREARELIRNSRAVLRQDPTSAAANFYLGEAYWAEGDETKAAHHFREALRLDPAQAGANQRLSRDLQGY